MKLKQVLRADLGELEKPKKMANGWLRVDARTTRVGVFDYRNADGTMRGELRLPDEVFSKETLDSFALVPVTDEHPPEFLTADNAKEYSRGAAGEKPHRDGDWVRSPLMITDAELIQKMEKGEAREISNGYNCDLEHAPGIWKGQRYDYIQRNIRGNHVAVVPRGRAGPGAHARMDAVEIGVLRSDAEGGPKPAKPKEHTLKTISIGGMSFEVEDTVAQAYAVEQKRNADAFLSKEEELKKAKEEAEKEKAKADAAVEKSNRLDSELKEAPAKFTALAKARADLEAKVAKVVGPKEKLDKLDTKGLQLLALAKLSPDTKFDGKTDTYIEARFDAALEQFDADERDDDDESPSDRARADLEPVDDQHNDEAPVDADAAYAKMRKDNAEAWKQTLKRHDVDA